MIRILKSTFLLFFMISFISCSHKTFTPAYSTPKEGYTHATVINYTIDGCTYLLQLEDGKKLEPDNLKDEYKKDNLKVWIKYQPRKGNSICMAGEMITIIDIFKEK